MRMQRFDWLAQFFRPRPARQSSLREKSDRSPLRLWRYAGIDVEAHTRSEARGKLKRMLQLNRLPVGAKPVLAG